MYEYICMECGVETEHPDYSGIGQIRHGSCALCGGLQRRQITTFRTKKSMQPHFNPAVGRPISSDREFTEALARKSDEMSAKTGMDHRYVPVDMNDKAALGVTDEGLDTTARVRRESGLDEPTKRIIV